MLCLPKRASCFYLWALPHAAWVFIEIFTSFYPQYCLVLTWLGLVRGELFFKLRRMTFLFSCGCFRPCKRWHPVHEAPANAGYGKGPRILAVVCSGCKNDVSSGAAADSTKDMLTFREFNTILEGLAECLKCRGHGTQELRLRRLTIKVLAFVAASGKSGFEVLLNPKISKGGNFLELIMLALASEMDAEAVESSELSETCKERTWLIREALIFLNRLASSPAYSGVVLQVLTSSRDTASVTIDIVNRMSRKSTDWWSSDSTKKRKAEDEIVDLSRVFRSRVFAYLGNNAS